MLRQCKHLLKRAKNGQIWVLFKNEWQPLKYLVKKYGVSANVVNARIGIGWSVGKALTTPVKRINIDNEKDMWIDDENE